MTDPIADLLTRIRNAQKAQIQYVSIPHSRIKFELAQKLVEAKYVKTVEEKGEGKEKEIIVELDFDRVTPLTLKRVSRPGQRIYKKKDDLKVIMNGLGAEILSTSQGIKTNYEAYKENLGGEVLCLVY